MNQLMYRVQNPLAIQQASQRKIPLELQRMSQVQNQLVSRPVLHQEHRHVDLLNSLLRNHQITPQENLLVYQQEIPQEPRQVNLHSNRVVSLLLSRLVSLHANPQIVPQEILL